MSISLPPSLARYAIPAECVHEGATIGHGACGVVLQATIDHELASSPSSAIKKIFFLQNDAQFVQRGGALSPAERAHCMREFFKECEIMASCAHPYIVPFVGVVIDPRGQPVAIASQFVESGTLHDLLYHERYASLRGAVEGAAGEGEARQLLRPRLVMQILEQLFLGLEYLHTRAQGVVLHRDVKPSNVLAVVEQGVFRKIMLADLGLAKVQSRTQTVGTVGMGTPSYMAPEMREQEDSKGPAADIFSAGVLAVELASGKQPNPGPEQKKVGRRRQVH